jgi:hypothetical protein
MTDPPDGDTRNPDVVTQAQAAASSYEVIGPYHLLRQVGAGGTGEVWLADQTRPVHRQVALKAIKAGMDTAHVLARFEAERHARLDDDAGAVTAGVCGADERRLACSP